MPDSMNEHFCDPRFVAVFASTPLQLASRASKLALLQTEQVAHRLNAHEALPIATRISGFTTQGDAIKQHRLTAYGGKGLFVRQLEKRLLAGKCDAAVHSGKDMETALATGTCIASVLPRGDRRDALVGAHASIDALPEGAVIGTASVRRTALLRSIRPDLQVRLLRGNVPSRLQALKDGKYDAIILAKAGLDRLGISRDVHPISSDIMLPAAAQGAIVVQALSSPQSDSKGDSKGENKGNDKITIKTNNKPMTLAVDAATRIKSVLSVLTAIDDPASRLEVMAERKILAVLDGSCQTPIAACAEVVAGDEDKIRLRACISSLDGREKYSDDQLVSQADAIATAEDLATALLARAGGRKFLYATANDFDPD